ncbi:hypothetical protein J6590_039141 [Homalodisca vitripennis]|nr:hypothetical protein J6590_039141 [Homalodisca vitripennis]
MIFNKIQLPPHHPPTKAVLDTSLARAIKRIVRVVAGISRRSSCRNAFKEHSVFTFPSLYIYETIIFAKFHGANVCAVHDHNTRARVDLRQTQHRSALASGLPQNTEARFFWKPPKRWESQNMCDFVHGDGYTRGPHTGHKLDRANKAEWATRLARITRPEEHYKIGSRHFTCLFVANLPNLITPP